MALSCPHGYASPASCVECMFDGPVAAPPRPVTWSPTEHVRDALYPSTCRLPVGCGEPIEVGVRIRRWSTADDDTMWLHDGCSS